MAGRPLVYILICSLRVVRQGPMIAEWVLGKAQAAYPSLEFKVVDIRDYDLPLESLEPHIPITGNYTQPGTIQWSEAVTRADAIVFLTPIYNGTYPAAIKNALDYLKKEWVDKPAAIVSYSRRGSDSAAVDLGVLLTRLQMRLVKTYSCLRVGAVVGPEPGIPRTYEYEVMLETLHTVLSNLQTMVLDVKAE